MTFLVHINESPYAVEDSDIEEFEDRILKAVRHGGSFVDVSGVTDRLSRVLVTPASSVRIEKLRRVEPSEIDEEFSDFAFFDLDL
jgi:hypothetical protein